MHNEAQIILQQVFNKRSLNDVSLDELKDITEQFPYFNAAHFLLAKKIRLENADATVGSRHPALFFHNPLWYNFLMKKDMGMNGEMIEDELVLSSGNLTVETELTEDVTEDSGEEHQIHDEASRSDQERNFIAEKVVAEKTLTQSGKDESLEFEPFHTIDYFASQGIRLQQADLSRDKFGQQLKSFTEWLKSMKKIPAPSPDDTGDPVVQEQVVQFAQISNETKEIITETMAEVWSLQGNRQKAIDIYKKLSLLNPAKSAYFASKIDKLNS